MGMVAEQFSEGCVIVPLCYDDHERKKFIVDEWRSLRNQSMSILNFIWRLEILSIGGVFAYYGWLMKNDKEFSSDSSFHIFLHVVPCVFLIVVIMRLKIEYSILSRMANYCLLVERFVYGDVSSLLYSGWHDYLKNNPQSKISYWRISGKYKHTFAVFPILLMLSCAFAANRTGLFGGVTSALQFLLIALHC